MIQRQSFSSFGLKKIAQKRIFVTFRQLISNISYERVESLNIYIFVHIKERNDLLELFLLRTKDAFQLRLELHISLLEERNFFGMLALFHGAAFTFSFFNRFALCLQFQNGLFELSLFVFKLFDLG